MPADFQVYCDPTLRSYAGEELNGFYLYDDQGVKARRVDVVKDGILREFLMSRVPLDGFRIVMGMDVLPEVVILYLVNLIWWWRQQRLTRRLNCVPC